MDTVAVACAGVFLLMCLYLLWFWFCFGNYVKRRQKTRNPPPRRMYVGSHPRQSLGQQEPTIYVSPSNLPPPPKYECMAPPSYEEVVGVHYPQFSAQPITQPINNALAQSSSTQPEVNNTTSITVINEPRRTSVTVART